MANEPAQYTNELAKLRGPQRDAAAALILLFSQYGLQNLAARIIDMVKQGFSADTMSVMLEETPEYKARFAANDARVKRGLPKLSPKEYIETERAYRAVMANSGMPNGFWDSNSDFQKHLENDMSPAELQERVQTWQSVAQQDQTALDQLRRLYGFSAGDYAAYLMDRSRAVPLLQRQARAVQFASAGSRHGYTLDRSLAERFGGGAYNVTGEEAERGFAAIAEVQGDIDALGRLHRIGGYGVEEAVEETFAGDADAAKKRKKISEAERSTFAGSSRGDTGVARPTTSY